MTASSISASRNFSTILSAAAAVSEDTSLAVTRAERASAMNASARTAPTQQAGWPGARRPTPTAAAAAAAAAVARRAPAPQARSLQEALTTRDIGIGPCFDSTAQDSLAKRVPFSAESVLPPVPQSFKCPITHEVMRDPVMTQDGHVYESDAIQEWFRRGHRTSPVTGAELVNLALLPEVPLRRAIEEYMALRPEIARRELTLRSDLLNLRNVVEKLEQEAKVKDRMLREALHCSRRAEASGTAVKELCSARDCVLEASPGSTSSTCAKGELAEKARSPEAMRVLATLPTPCRDGVRTRKAAEAIQPTQPISRTNKLQELIKAMSWRGRTNRRSGRSRSQDPDAHY